MIQWEARLHGMDLYRDGEYFGTVPRANLAALIADAAAALKNAGPANRNAALPEIAPDG